MLVQVVYPLVAELVDEHMRDHAVDEHDSLKLFSSDLENQKVEDEGFEDKMHQLMEVNQLAELVLSYHFFTASLHPVAEQVCQQCTDWGISHGPHQSVPVVMTCCVLMHIPETATAFHDHVVALTCACKAVGLKVAAWLPRRPFLSTFMRRNTRCFMLCVRCWMSHN